MTVLLWFVACRVDPADSAPVGGDPPTVPTVPTVPGSPTDTDLPPDPSPTPSQWGSCIELRSVVAFGGPHKQYLDDVAPAPDGGRFVSLHSSGPVTLGAGTPSEETFVPIDFNVGVLARYDAADQLSWAMRFDGPYEGGGRSLALLSGGGVVAESWCNGETLVDGGAVPADCPLLGGWGDAWLLGLDAEGAAVSSSWYGGPKGGPPGDIVALPDGGVALAGTLLADVIFGQGEPGETVVRFPPDALFAGAVARFAPGGALVWAQSFGGSTVVEPYGLAYDATADALSVVGIVSGTGAATWGTGSDTVTVDPAGEEIFVARYSSDGSVQWVKTGGGTQARALAVTAASGGSVTTTGDFTGVVTLGMGDRAEASFAADGFAMWVARYEADGALAWAATSAYDNRDSGGVAVATTQDDRTLVATGFEELLVLGGGTPAEGVFATSTLADDAVLALYGPDGSYLCGVQLANVGGPLSYLLVLGIVARSDGGFDVYGDAAGTVRFGTGSPDEMDLPTDDLDGFIATIDVVTP